MKLQQGNLLIRKARAAPDLAAWRRTPARRPRDGRRRGVEARRHTAPGLAGRASRLPPEAAGESSQAPDWLDRDLVFAPATGGYIDPKHDSIAWHRLLGSAWRPPRPPPRRPTHTATLLLLEVDQGTVMDIMGCTEMRTLLRYTPVVDELRQAAAEEMGDALWPDWANEQ